MDLFDKEAEIIEYMRETPFLSVMLAPSDSEECKKLFESLFDEEKWKEWIDSAGKGDPPPDFYSDIHGYMMDVMRVDDHGYISEKGKTVNPTRKRETEIMHELRDKGILDAFPQAKTFMTVSTELPTDEDHNYKRYIDNFARIVGAHLKKVAQYKANHPALKTVFFVFDEASPYMQTQIKTVNPVVGKSVRAMPHLWFADKAMVEIFANADIDYLIWFAPYKHCDMFDDNGNAVNFPPVVVYDIKNMDIELTEYDADLMESVEL